MIGCSVRVWFQVADFLERTGRVHAGGFHDIGKTGQMGMETTRTCAGIA